MKPSSLRRSLLPCLALTFAAIPANAAVLYFSDGSDISGYVGRNVARPDGGTVETTTPLVINGNSQGSYYAATEYPAINFTSTTAAAAGTQEIWVSFVMGRDARNAWAGGILLGSGTVPGAPGNPTIDVAALMGWSGNANAITLRNGNEAVAAGQTGQSLATAGQTVAVLAQIYENGTDGLFNRGEIYFDDNLADGITFPTTGGINLDLSTGANATIDLLRLNADGNGETRYYDNIVVATTQAEALALVPEPTITLLSGLGLMALLRRRRTL